MVRRIISNLESWQRRRRLAQIRREFARHGLPVEHVTDSAMESALTRGGRSLSDITLNAKSIYLASRRLLRDHEQYPRRLTIEPAVQPKGP
jgi:hypothetical protein